MKVTLLLIALLLSASQVGAADKADKKNPEVMLKALDTDKDGSLSKEEYLKSKEAQKNTTKADKRFTKANANKDGKLSKEEFVASARGKKKNTSSEAPANPEDKKPVEQK